MTGLMLAILVGVLLAAVIFSNVLNLLGGHHAVLKRLGEAFPAQPPAMDAAKGRGMLLLQELPVVPEMPIEPDPRRPGGMPGAWSKRPYLVNTRLTFDESFLHLALDSGPLGPRREASVPWSAMTLRTRETPKHYGEIAAVEAGGFLLALPAHALEPYLQAAGIVEDVVDVEYRAVEDDDRPVA